MNGNGYNVKDQNLPDMLLYFNIALSDETITTTRQKYTWLDAFAFVGGNIDVILIIIHVFFYYYNYGLNRYQVYFKLE